MQSIHQIDACDGEADRQYPRQQTSRQRRATVVAGFVPAFLSRVLSRHRPIAYAVTTALASTVLLLPGAQAAPKPTKSASGTLAVVNLDRAGSSGHEVVARVQQQLKSRVGGWATQPAINEHVVGRPNPGILPSGDSGRELGVALQRLRQRSGRATTDDLWQLGRLLAVDYLLLVRARGATVRARLFSVQRQRYSPDGFQCGASDVSPIRAYVVSQAKKVQPERQIASKTSWRSRWWVFAIAGGLAALTVGLAVGASADDSGTLRIRVSK